MWHFFIFDFDEINMTAMTDVPEATLAETPLEEAPSI